MTGLHLFLSGPCLNFSFWNNAGVPFILYSSLKPEGYLVTGPKLHLRYAIRRGVVEALQPMQPKRHRVADYDEEVLSQVKSIGLLE